MNTPASPGQTSNPATQAPVPEVLWSYKLHEEMVFYQRINFFLVAESMLFVAYTTLLAASSPKLGMLLSLVVLGILLSLAWLLVSHRQIGVIDNVSAICLSRLEDYKLVRNKRPSSIVKSSQILAYGVPVIIMATWIIALKLQS